MQIGFDLPQRAQSEILSQRVLASSGHVVFGGKFVREKGKAVASAVGHSVERAKLQLVWSWLGKISKEGERDRENVESARIRFSEISGPGESENLLGKMKARKPMLQSDYCGGAVIVFELWDKCGFL